MKQEDCNEELGKEKEKLNKLVDQALNKGILITQDEVVIAQSHKVDTLVVKIQKEQGKNRKTGHKLKK